MSANSSGSVMPPSVFIIAKASFGFVKTTPTVSKKAFKNPSSCRCSQGSPDASEPDDDGRDRKRFGRRESRQRRGSPAITSESGRHSGIPASHAMSVGRNLPAAQTFPNLVLENSPIFAPSRAT